MYPLPVISSGNDVLDFSCKQSFAQLLAMMSLQLPVRAIIGTMQGQIPYSLV